MGKLLNYLSTGAGLLPSTVSHIISFILWVWKRLVEFQGRLAWNVWLKVGESQNLVKTHCHLPASFQLLSSTCKRRNIQQTTSKTWFSPGMCQLSIGVFCLSGFPTSFLLPHSKWQKWNLNASAHSTPISYLVIFACHFVLLFSEIWILLLYMFWCSFLYAVNFLKPWLLPSGSLRSVALHMATTCSANCKGQRVIFQQVVSWLEIGTTPKNKNQPMSLKQGPFWKDMSSSNHQFSGASFVCFIETSTM